MEIRAHDIVLEYIWKHLDKSDNVPTNIEVYTVWKCKALQNWKFLISSSLLDGMYYELTFNGDRNEWYLDAYKKFENQVIREDKTDTPQTNCNTCRYGQDKHRYAHICNECGVGINNYTPQTDGYMTEKEEFAFPSDCQTCEYDLWSTPRTCGKCIRRKDGKPSMYEPRQTNCYDYNKSEIENIKLGNGISREIPQAERNE